MSLDLSRLGNVVDTGDGYTAACPACRAEDHDKTGNHLRIFPDGRFGCVVHPGDHGDEHRREIFGLVGIHENGKPARQWRLRVEGGGYEIAVPAKEGYNPRAALSERLATLTAEAAAIKETIIREYAWSKAAVDAGSAPLPKSATGHWQAFLRKWRPEDILWVGGRYDKGDRLIFRSAAYLLKNWPDPSAYACDHTTGWVWREDAANRCDENLVLRRFLSVESDDLPIPAQLAVLRWIRDELGLNLQMITHTTGKSIHGLFDAPPEAQMPRLTAILSGLGIDRQSLRRSATRIPGAVRLPDPKHPDKPCGNVQRLVYLNPFPSTH